VRIENLDMWAMGVHRATVEGAIDGFLPYVAPAAFEQLRRHLQSGLGAPGFRRLVVSGDRGTGRTRLAFEALAAVAADRRAGGGDEATVWVITPSLDQARSDIDLARRPELPADAPVVIWLDDVERFLREPSAALNVTDLARIRATYPDRSIAVLATMVTPMVPSAERALPAIADLWRGVRAFLRGATVVSLDGDCDPLQVAHTFGPPAAAAIQQVGIGAWACASDAMRTTYQDGIWSGATSPPVRAALGEALALIDALLAWKIAVTDDPVSLTTARQLWPSFRAQRGVGGFPGASGWERAVAVATGECAPGRALARIVNDDDLEVSQELVRYADCRSLSARLHDSDSTVPGPLSDALRDPVKAHEIGGRTWHIHPELAETAYEAGIASGHRDLAPCAWFNLGALRQATGDVAGALEAYRRAADSGHAEQAPRALLNLGVLLSQEDDLEGAHAAYDRIIRTGHPQQTPRALVNLARLLGESGDVEGAHRAYERAVASDDPEQVALAHARLGELLFEEGDLSGACEAFDKAAAGGVANAASAADGCRALLRGAAGDASAIRDEYQRMADGGDPEVALLALEALAEESLQHGDMDGARATWDRRIAIGELGTRLAELFVVARDLTLKENLKGAAAAYAVIAETDHPDAAPKAMVNLADVLFRMGDAHAGEEMLRRAVASGNPNVAARAFVALASGMPTGARPDGVGKLWPLAIATGQSDLIAVEILRDSKIQQEEGDRGGALTTLQVGVMIGHPDVSPRAMVMLAELLSDLGHRDQSRSAYEAAINTGHLDASARAWGGLGVLLGRSGDTPGARAAYDAAIATGHPEQAPAAMVNLGVLLKEAGDVAGARAAYERAIATGHQDEAPKALVNLGVLLDKVGDTIAAREYFRKAIATAHREETPRALVNLGVLLQLDGDLAGARDAYERAIATEHPREAPCALFSLGVLHHKSGKVAEARDAYDRAIATDHPDEAPRALNNLVALLQQQDDLDGIREACERAVATNPPEVATVALAFLNRFGFAS
jgi:tetratricopeptide (TPR) repeat protein